MASITRPEDINRFRMFVILKGIDLEAKGIKPTRGRSCLSIAKGILGLPKGAKRETVRAALASLIESL